MHGPCMNHAWSMRFHARKEHGHIHGPCMEFTWTMHGSTCCTDACHIYLMEFFVRSNKFYQKSCPWSKENRDFRKT